MRSVVDFLGAAFYLRALAVGGGASNLERMTSSVSATGPEADGLPSPLPELVVFDLDDCLWSPEMFTLDEIPTKCVMGNLGGRGEGVVGVKSTGQVIRLFPAALEVLQDFHEGKYPGMRIAAASSADTPRAVEIGTKALTMLEVVPGVTVRQVFSQGFPEGTENMQIGRTPPLSSNKAKTHFPFLQRATQVPYDNMLFFDDCNWSNHCAIVKNAFPAITCVRTPRGLQRREWELGLYNYAQVHRDQEQ